MRTLYRNGRIYSAAVHEASALLVEDATITWIGQEDGIEQHAAVRTIDLVGAFVTPAFVDAHVHVTETGLALTGLDLSGADSL
ncbi:MAG: amidohydrolase family protein, partial [Jatrophihabitantaceae bacterium]